MPEKNRSNDKVSRVTWYGITIFLSSAFLLVLEIVAGRLIAPYVGVSLYTWTSIIGVILAGLSLGNWLGGVWADRGGEERSAGLILALGGLFCLASLLLLSLVAPLIQQSSLGLLGSSFLYVLILFFVPAALLGVVTPLLTTLALRLDTRTGHIVGRMHALAAIGSILGTFVTGYWLIQYFGTRNIVLGTAAGLFLLATPYLRGTRRLVPVSIAIAAFALTAITYARNGFANPCNRESNYFCIRVVDHSADAPYGVAKGLVLDYLLHGINHKSEPGLLIAPYIHLMDELVLRHFGDKYTSGLSYFFAGGGAYSQPRAVQELSPRSQITVAELDPEVTDMAVRELYVNPDGMRIIHRDARVVLAQSSELYDVVIMDVFHDVAVPYHLLTREFARLVRSRLRPEGIYAMNIVDVFPDPRLVKSVLKTLRGEFKRVTIWMDTIPQTPTRVTYVISASNSNELPDLIRSRGVLERTWYAVTEPLLATGTPIEEVPELTDDFTPVERLISDLLIGANS